MALSKPSPSFSDFGEVPRTVRGSEKVLTIQEVDVVGQGEPQPTGVEFRFARENFTQHRGPLSLGITLRTVRTDLPGAETPTEQVLGWNHKPFTVQGIWDDRRAGAGYAFSTYQSFEEMVKRGKRVRIQFEQISYLGLITEFDVTYRRKDYITYSFNVSPHNRFQAETVRVDPNAARKIVSDPKNSVKKARDRLDQMKLANDLARARSNARVQQLLTSDVFSQINTTLDTLDGFVGSLEHLADKELLGPAEATQRALARGAQTVVSARTSAASLISSTAGLSSSTSMTSASFVEILKFDSWHRQTSGIARLFVTDTEQTRRDLALRARPKAQRLHRVRLGESLYQISLRYYGTPHHWREILTANHLSSIVLEGGELLEIPEIRL